MLVYLSEVIDGIETKKGHQMFIALILIPAFYADTIKGALLFFDAGT